MEISALSEINQKFIKSQLAKQPQVEKIEPKQEEPEKKPNNGKKILLALGGLAAAGIATVAILKKGKSLSLEKFKEAGVFDLGKAIFKGKPYTGKITVGPKGAQKVITYKKGKMVSAFADGIMKKYNYNVSDKLESVDKILNKNVVETLNLADLKSKVLQDRVTLNNLFENQKQYNFERFYDEAVNNIRYKSKADNERINDILEYKDKMEYIVSARTADDKKAELIARNAQAKFNAPFEQKLSHKSAKGSANVFIQKEIENARKAQDALISYMQKPSSKKASDSAKVFIANS